MKTKLLIGSLMAALLVAGACSKSGNTNTPAANANKPAASPTQAATSPTPAAQSSTSPGASTAGAQDFTLVNSTGVVLDKVFIAPHDSKDWEEDILGKDTLGDGESVDIKFDRKETAEMWDLRIEDKEGTYIEWENLELLKIRKVTLKFENKKPTAVTE